MSASTSAAMAGVFSRPRLIRGVCADLAARAGTVVWLPRAAFVLLGLMHWFWAVVLYVVLARTLCAARTRFAVPVSPAPDTVGVRDRFGALDARLANLEAATLHDEAGLRRAFRDLEAGR